MREMLCPHTACTSENINNNVSLTCSRGDSDISEAYGILRTAFRHSNMTKQRRNSKQGGNTTAQQRHMPVYRFALLWSLAYVDSFGPKEVLMSTKEEQPSSQADWAMLAAVHVCHTHNLAAPTVASWVAMQDCSAVRL